MCTEHLLELNIFIEATSLASWVCHFLASSFPSQIGSTCLEVQAKAVTHSFHFWTFFFLYKRRVLGFSRNGYFCLLTIFHPYNYSCIGVCNSFSELGNTVADNNRFFNLVHKCLFFIMDHRPLTKNNESGQSTSSETTQSYEEGSKGLYSVRYKLKSWLLKSLTHTYK